MSQTISRRFFLTASGAALLGPRISRSAEQVPHLLDHILLGCNDLDRGIAFMEDHTGARAAFGGVHPGRGTRNALLALGKLHYLEIIAPDPEQSEVASRFGDLRSIVEPRLIAWAAHPADINALAEHLRDAGIAYSGPTPGSRTRPDGKILHWATLDLADNPHGLLPFFIQWSPDSPHPSVDAPKGCRLGRFSVSTPHPEELSKLFRQLELDVEVDRDANTQLRAQIVGPRGTLQITS
jgi:catechol 2,3-dioxygenase-like lactoylglutathione lyase family enzyme